MDWGEAIKKGKLEAVNRRIYNTITKKTNNDLQNTTQKTTFEAQFTMNK
jgi:hypothetical protein